MSFYLGSNKGPWRRAMQTIRVRAPPPLKKFTCIKVQSWPGAPGSPFTLSIGSLFSYQAPYQDNHGRFVESGESTGDGYENCRPQTETTRQRHNRTACVGQSRHGGIFRAHLNHGSNGSGPLMIPYTWDASLAVRTDTPVHG